MRVALHRLRQTLDAAGVSEQLLTITRQTLQFNASGATVDVACFQALLDASAAHAHSSPDSCPSCLSQLDQAVALYRGELLAGFGLADAPAFEEWLLLRREMLQHRALLALKNLADAYLASASWDNTVRLWDVASGQVRHLLEGHTGIAQGVSFSPDGRTLASSSYDGTVRLWDVASGQAGRVLKGHANWVHFVTFSPDGSLLASCGGDETIRLWDPDTGACLQTWRIPGPYEGMRISGVTGVTEAQKAALKALGAVA